MVPDPEVRVRLDRVAGELAEAGPAVEEAGPAGDDRGDRVASGRVGKREGLGEAVDGVGRFGVEHGLRQTPAVDNEIGWSVTGEEVMGCAGRIRGSDRSSPQTRFAA